MNQKGQEFSVFKLLISAIVAIVILTLLLQILNVIDIGVTTEPDKAAEDLLKSIDASSYQEKVSTQFDFKSEHSISAAALANKSGLDQDQICLGVEQGLIGFEEESSATLISYSGDSSVRVKLAGICGAQNQFDTEDLIETTTSKLKEKGIDFGSLDCACPQGSQKCCVIVLIKSDE
ncbi:hypothetical protein KKB11_01395 [Candidatus Micrarchaeota archaeon]|nr:hypothetical protein [Candidatus Micrarchaeota archaeon]